MQSKIFRSTNPNRLQTPPEALTGAWSFVRDFTRWLVALPGFRSLIVFLLPFSLYLFTMAPTIYNLDSAELTTAAATGGLMRSTGYPLYLTIGYFWSRLPVGDVGYRMNLLSAFCGALTIWLAWRILRRWQVEGWAAFGALGLLAAGTYFWGLSLVAEVYTMQTAITAGILLALLRWGEQPTPRRMLGVGVLVGLGASHHAATILLVPGALLYILTRAPHKVFSLKTGWRLALGGLAGFLLGLSPYLYFPLRYAARPVFNYAGWYDADLVFHPANLASLQGILWLVSGQSFSQAMFAYRGAALWREVGSYLVQLWGAFFALGVGPGLLGLAILLRKRWQEGVLLLSSFACSAFFFIDYRVVDKNTMFLPSYLVWGLWAALGYSQLLVWLRNSELHVSHAWGSWALKAAMAAAVLVAAGWNWQLVDLSRDWSARERGETILRSVEPGALVFGWWDTVPVIQYLQLVEGYRPDVQAINRFFIDPQAFSQIVKQEVKYRPIYIDNPPTDILQTLSARSIGPIQQIYGGNP